MRSEKENRLRYSIFDPTGNITALVESPVEESCQPSVAAAIMARHTAVEQVGFLRLPAGEGETPALRMAGGEFCGNASMSAAALWALRRGLDGGECSLRVSGAESAVSVRLRRETEGSFAAAVHMPPAGQIMEKECVISGRRGRLSCVYMEGITHAVITPASAFFALKDDHPAAERAVRTLCAALGANCLGLMFLEEEMPRCRLTPLVWVPASGTLFWENSCASGSAAVGMLLARQSGKAIDLTLEEPGGELRVESNTAKGETWLHGRTKLLGEYVA